MVGGGPRGRNRAQLIGSRDVHDTGAARRASSVERAALRGPSAHTGAVGAARLRRLDAGARAVLRGPFASVLDELAPDRPASALDPGPHADGRPLLAARGRER